MLRAGEPRHLTRLVGPPALSLRLPVRGSESGGCQSGTEIAVERRPSGFDIDLTTQDPTGVSRLRGLGFFGLLAAGDHHRFHHLGLATGTIGHHHQID